MNEATRKILLLGASGLIGRFVTDDLRTRGFRVTGVARNLSAAQKMSSFDVELPILSLDRAALARLLNEYDVDVIVNCLGVLQDGPGSDTGAVHRDFWIAATSVAPKTLAQAIGRHSATIQDKWFARLFLIKALVIASLVAFWVISGFIALFISYRAAAGILTTHGFPPALVDPITIGTSLMDMSIGVSIAFRRTCAIGLVAGVIASLGYMVGSAILTPDLWIEPLGALVKTGPAIVLMLVALLTLDNR